MSKAHGSSNRGGEILLQEMAMGLRQYSDTDFSLLERSRLRSKRPVRKWLVRLASLRRLG